MKKLLLTLLVMSYSLTAQVGPQPLYISNITFNPQGGCGAGNSVNILATAAGGQPPYTYSLINRTTGIQVPGSPQTSPTATFTDVENGVGFNLLVTDSAGTSIKLLLETEPSQTQQIIMNITSLPLGTGPGCITLQVVGPAGKSTGTALVTLTSTLGSQVGGTTPIPAPFIQQFSAFPTSGTSRLIASVFVFNDCTPVGFDIEFPFPQGTANALKAYIFNKYCSCALSKATLALPAM